MPKISRCIVERIYNPIFIRKYLFLDGKIINLIQIILWLILGNDLKIYKHDMTMLYHELEEEKIMGDSLEVVYETTHKEVEKNTTIGKNCMNILKLMMYNQYERRWCHVDV